MRFMKVGKYETDEYEFMDCQQKIYESSVEDLGDAIRWLDDMCQDEDQEGYEESQANYMLVRAVLIVFAAMARMFSKW